MKPEECLMIYGAAWFERDADKRVDVLRQCCTEDVVFMDPQLGRLHGLDAVSKMIGDYTGEMSAGATPSETEVGERGLTASGVGAHVKGDAVEQSPAGGSPHTVHIEGDVTCGATVNR